jgi:heptosyltransferase-2
MTPQKILVRMPNWVGDFVMATPLLLDVRRRFPASEITAMCLAPLGELLAYEEAVDEVFVFQRPERGFLRRQERRNLVGKLRTGGYDVGILTTNSFSSAWWLWQGGVKRRIGFRGNWRSWLLTDPLDKPAGVHQVEAYKALLTPLGIPRSETAPRLTIGKEEQAVARELLRQQGIGDGIRIVGVHAGATYGGAKKWPGYRELAAKLLKEQNIAVVFIGANGEAEEAKRLTEGLGPFAVSLAGKTTLAQLVALIQKMDVLVANDSGPMHIGAALGVPVVALFGSTDPDRTGPYGQPGGVIAKRPSCSPCFQRECPIDFRCMRAIGADEVAAKVRACLGS